MSSTGIYIHVPFCAKKCGYCDFYSESFSRQLSDDYIKAVLRNIRHFSDECLTAETVYFGGGTPSLLNPQQLKLIIDELHQSFEIPSDAEITIEANPSTLSAERLSAYLDSGINRLSLGVQSMLDEELSFLGRSHTAERAKKAVLDAHSAGFRNISCDLMIALPEQTKDALIRSADKLTALPIQHISAYILKVEEHTPFSENGIQKLLPNDDTTAELYLTMVAELEKHGFMQYEVSNFAKDGFRSRHNCRYWLCEDYIGIGPSAHSCHNGKRFAVPPDIHSFIRSEFQHTDITDSAPCGFEEFSMLRLRLKDGLNLSDVEAHRNDIEKKIPQLVREGYVCFDGETVSLTAKGFLISNSIIEYLVF